MSIEPKNEAQPTISDEKAVSEKKVRLEKQVTSEKETGRLEAFSDGVIAIAITLLVLEIKIPDVKDTPGALRDALTEQWPIYFTYITSFLTILVMWLNHHRLFKLIVRTNQLFLILNGLLLMVITLVPFPTALVAEYVQDKNDNQVWAVAIFNLTYAAMAVMFNILWRYAAYNNRLLAKDANPLEIKRIHEQYRYGPLLYIIIFLIGLVNVWISLIVSVALVVFFAVPNPLMRGADDSAD